MRKRTLVWLAVAALAVSVTGCGLWQSGSDIARESYDKVVDSANKVCQLKVSKAKPQEIVQARAEYVKASQEYASKRLEGAKDFSSEALPESPPTLSEAMNSICPEVAD